MPHVRAESAAIADAALEMPSGQSACAVLLQDASFAWATQADATEGSHADEAKRPASAPARGWALSQSRDVLQELSLAIPQGSLTAIVGDIGSGEHAHPAHLSSRHIPDTNSVPWVRVWSKGKALVSSHGSPSVNVKTVGFGVHSSSWLGQCGVCED